MYKNRAKAGWVLLCVLIVLAAVRWLSPQDVGRPQMFRDQTYHFESLRVLNDIAAVGGDVSEAAQAVAALKQGTLRGGLTRGRPQVIASRRWQRIRTIQSQRATRTCAHTTTIGARSSS